MTKAFKECKKEIEKMLLREKKLIKQLKKIQRTKMEIILILGGINENS